MQSIVSSKTGGVEKALLYLSITYNSCVIVADRISGHLQHLTAPCPQMSYFDSAMLADTPIAAHSFSFPQGMWGKKGNYLPM